MKFLFIYPEVTYTNVGRFQRGIAYLSATLRLRGHETKLIVVNKMPEDNNGFLSEIKAFQPDMIGYSSISSQAPYVKKLARITKELGIFTVWGGVHPTLDPDNSIMVDGIDAIGIGEVDFALPQFVDTYAKGGAIDLVNSFYVKLKDGRVIKNPTAPVLENLDELPIPDYDLFPYDKTDDFMVAHAVTVQTSRGCPFNCSYCANNALRKIYPNAKNYMRIRSVDNVIAEIEFLIKKYPGTKEVRFSDDTLSSSVEWFKEFCAKYKAKINIPWSTNERVEYITDEKADLYKASGCINVDMGIESGNEFIRHKIMKRKIKEEVMINGFKRMQSRGINTHAFNILGMPHETFSTALDTIKMNSKCNPSHYFNAYFHPFISTDAFTLSKELGLIQGECELPTSLAEKPVLKLPGISEQELMFLYKYFSTLVVLYRFLFRISSGSNSILVKSVDFTLKHLPGKWLLNNLYQTRTDVKRKFPRLSEYIIKAKRAIVRPITHS